MVARHQQQRILKRPTSLRPRHQLSHYRRHVGIHLRQLSRHGGTAHPSTMPSMVYAKVMSHEEVPFTWMAQRGQQMLPDAIVD
jgi:hypothetical protein